VRVIACIEDPVVIARLLGHLERQREAMPREHNRPAARLPQQARARLVLRLTEIERELK
jgi:hypothetical protein